MKIISIELVKYRRMSLNNIKLFRMKLNKIIQIILGDNGAGKSSLIKELSPLPADASDYHKSGSKTVQIIKSGSNYLLVSKFSPTTKHSFVKDDVELNPGGTTTVQRELCRQEFNITNDVHELLTGVENFCSMPASRRRDWFMRLADTSYEYAVSVYDKLKVRNRDIAGALKLAKKRLVIESEKLITPEDEIKLTKDVELIHTELNLIREQTAPVKHTAQHHVSNRNIQLDELHRLSMRLLRMKIVAPYGTDVYGSNPDLPPERDDNGNLIKPTFTSIKAVAEHISTINTSITVQETLLNKAIDEWKKQNDTLEILLKSGEDNVDTLQQSIKKLTKDKEKILAKCKIVKDLPNPKDSVLAFETIYDTLVEIFSTTPEGVSYQIGSNQEIAEQQEILSKQELIKTKKQRLAEYTQRLEHMEHHRDNSKVNCPKCQHSWIIGFDPTTYDKLTEAITKHHTEITTTSEALQASLEQLEKSKQFQSKYREYMRCVSNWAVLDFLWTHLNTADYINVSPKKALFDLELIHQDLLFYSDTLKIDVEIEKMEELIKSLAQVGDATINAVKLSLAECQLNIDSCTEKLVMLKKKHAAYNDYRKQLTEAETLSGKISQLITSSELENQLAIESLRQETLNHCIRQLQTSLAIKQEALTSLTMQKNLIANLNDQISKLSIDGEATELLVNTLSPTDGLIAEGLLEFIKAFVNQMNNVIKDVWEYPLSVQSCGVITESGAELDYKFPLVVPNEPDPITDVKFGSNGVRSIIDLAFKITAMKYLGLSESPLFLDEWGAGLSVEHRKNATATIKKLMDSKRFTQLFIISHYMEWHGVFTNSETCMLGQSSSIAPEIGKYNNHVEIV